MASAQAAARIGAYSRPPALARLTAGRARRGFASSYAPSWSGTSAAGQNFKTSDARPRTPHRQARLAGSDAAGGIDVSAAMSERIAEFLTRYDACKRRFGTPPAVWLDEAAELLRAMPTGDASPMTQGGLDARVTVLVAEALEAGLPHDENGRRAGAPRCIAAGVKKEPPGEERLSLGIAN